jgi:ligand-binding sensor domain-containing protein
VWVISGVGSAWWDSAAGEWTIYTPATTGNALPPYYISEFDQAADGALWLATQKEGLIRARPKEGEWTLVHAPVLFEYQDEVQQLVIAGDGSIWLATDTGDTVYRCEL